MKWTRGNLKIGPVYSIKVDRILIVCYDPNYYGYFLIEPNSAFIRRFRVNNEYNIHNTHFVIDYLNEYKYKPITKVIGVN